MSANPSLIRILAVDDHALIRLKDRDHAFSLDGGGQPECSSIQGAG